jgi:hypothetical protein
MQIDRREVLKRIEPQWKVLDIGSWEDIFPRANVVLDVLPYETRKNNHPQEKECFTKNSWFIGDVNQLETWERFKDKEFDFVICSHLLEDIRDPIFVCQQLNRVAKRGYIESPSRFRECSKIRKTDTYAGYDHHRWIFDVIDNDLVFTAKLHWANHIDYLGDSRRDCLSDYRFHFTGVFWEGAFKYYERNPKGGKNESINLIYFYDSYDYKNGQFIYEISEKNQITNIKAGSFLWIDKFRLPVENLPETEILRLETVFKNLLRNYDAPPRFIIVRLFLKLVRHLRIVFCL